MNEKKNTELNQKEMQSVSGGVTFFTGIDDIRYSKDMKTAFCVKCSKQLEWSDEHEAYICPGCQRVFDINGEYH